MRALNEPAMTMLKGKQSYANARWRHLPLCRERLSCWIPSAAGLCVHLAQRLIQGKHKCRVSAADADKRILQHRDYLELAKIKRCISAIRNSNPVMMFNPCYATRSP